MAVCLSRKGMCSSTYTPFLLYGLYSSGLQLVVEGRQIIPEELGGVENMTCSPGFWLVGGRYGERWHMVKTRDVIVCVQSAFQPHFTAIPSVIKRLKRNIAAYKRPLLMCGGLAIAVLEEREQQLGARLRCAPRNGCFPFLATPSIDPAVCRSRERMLVKRRRIQRKCGISLCPLRRRPTTKVRTLC